MHMKMRQLYYLSIIITSPTVVFIYPSALLIVSLIPEYEVNEARLLLQSFSGDTKNTTARKNAPVENLYVCALPGR